jgi:hypothetical protein
MKTYTIDDITYIVHDGKLFCELEEDGAGEPSLPEPEVELPKPKVHVVRSADGTQLNLEEFQNPRDAKRELVVRELGKGKTPKQIFDEHGIKQSYTSTLKWSLKKQGDTSGIMRRNHGITPPKVDATPADFGFAFTKAQKQNIIVMYKAGLSFTSIAKKMETNNVQIAEYVEALIGKGEIKPRAELAPEPDVTELD